MSVSVPAYRERVTVVDVLEAGACTQGVLEWVRDRGVIAVRTADYPGEKWIATAANADGYGDGGYGDGGYGDSGYGDGDSDGAGYALGRGTGNGNGNGTGYGYGYGYGYGDGDGYGYGDGGYGYGDGEEGRGDLGSVEAAL